MSDGTPIHIHELSQLRVHVYLIGYADQGESIVFILKEGTDNVLYSIVVDSYEIGDTNKTKELLKSPIDILCWTHPDADHSVGLDKIISGYCNKNSMVLLPYGLEEGVKIKNLGDVEPVINQVFDLGNRRAKPVYSVSAHQRQYDPIDSFQITDDYGGTINVTIRALAPNREYIFEKIHSNGEVEKNTLSIVLTVNVGPYRFLLTGDVEDMMISKMAKEEYQNPIWVKIPHHASNSSLTLLDYLLTGDSPQVLSGTTVKKASSLPNEDVVKAYLNICEQVNSTGDIREEPKENYGMVSYCYDLFGERTVRVHCEGNAVKLEKG